MIDSDDTNISSGISSSSIIARNLDFHSNLAREKESNSRQSSLHTFCKLLEDSNLK